jgi:hypothetical protein
VHKWTTDDAVEVGVDADQQHQHRTVELDPLQAHDRSQDTNNT